MTSLYLIVAFLALTVWPKSRKLALHFLPWILFAVCYDCMRFYPNYLVNDIDIQGLYEAEKSLFGITAQSAQELAAVADGSHTMTPCEYFSVHHCPAADFMAGVFYLCWVPVPIGFALYLYIYKEYEWFKRFSWAFLIVNLLGFVGYYIHPASPPWYVAQHGFTPIFNTPGNTAALGRWDAMTGLPIFHALYGKNANVFAAVPSLHAAYMLITTFYAIASRRKISMVFIFSIICLGIWWTAVYTGHHYIIDVLLGILTALAGVALWEIVYRTTRNKQLRKIHKHD